MLSINLIRLDFSRKLLYIRSCLFDIVNLRRDSQTAVICFVYKIYGRLLDRAIYHNNENKFICLSVT